MSWAYTTLGICIFIDGTGRASGAIRATLFTKLLFFVLYYIVGNRDEKENLMNIL